MATRYDVIVIGAGQAGLAMGYYLKQIGVSFCILGKERRVGETWSRRYDSLTLFTPRWYSALPGMKHEGDPNGYATKDEMADYLYRYAGKFLLPLRLNAEVMSVHRQDGCFIVATRETTYATAGVVVATGAFQRPQLPSFAHELSEHIVQLHSARYRNERQLQEGPVVIVGGGNSGAQIAEELCVRRPVYLSVGHALKYMPRELCGKSIFWWFDKLGVYRVSRQAALGKWLHRRGDPIIGQGLKREIAAGRVRLLPRAVDGSEMTLRFADGTALQPANIIWATGFAPQYRWLQLAGALDESGRPIHTEGISPLPGLYFLGLPWQTSRGSALIGGVGRDAAYVLAAMRTQWEKKDAGGLDEKSADC